jgi:hypothetical protein
MVLLVALGYHLKAYGLLYSTQGPAFGASYTDVHVRILVFRVLMVLSVLWSLFLIYNAFRPKMKLLLISGGVWVIAILALANGLPILVQQIVVKPNELAKESPFIAHNIEFTRKAYNLNNIKEVDFETNEDLSAEEISGHEVTIQNIRVWDERPLLQTYRQIQAIRLYYDFTNMDVDRYRIDNTYRQGVIDDNYHADLREAYEFIVYLQISRHLDALAKGEEPDNFLDPASLNSLQRKMLKESFVVIHKLQEILQFRYQTRLISGV